MSKKHLNITYAYHFMSEAIIIFLFAIPILYLHYRWIPYWSYLFTVVLLSVLFSIMAKHLTNYSIYIIVGLLLIPIFYFLNYPLIVNLLFSGLLIWRYINVRSRSMIDLNRENGYIILSIILATLGVIIVRDSEIVIYASALVILLIFGNIFSHLAVISQEDRRRFDKKSIVYIIGPIVLGTVFFIPFFQSGKMVLLKLWDGFRYLVYILASTLGRILQLFEQDRGWDDIAGIEGSSPPSEDPIYQQFEEKSLVEIIAPYAIIGIGLIIAIILVFLAIKLSKKVFKPLPEIPATNLVTYTALSDDESKSQGIFNNFKNRFRKPREPIRRHVFDFEKKMRQFEYGRKPYETIEEWLKRIGFTTNLEIYQKVRYGEEEVSHQEAETFKAELKRLESSLHSD